MFGKHRQTLQTLHHRVTSLAERIPARARRFHERCDHTRQRLANLLDRWWLVWVPKQELEHLEDAVNKLDRLAVPLADLLDRASALEREIQDTAAQCRGAASGRAQLAELSDWAETRSQDWLVELRQVGQQSERPPDVELDLDHVDALQGEIRRHAEAVDRLVLAHRLLERAEADPESALAVASVRADMPELRRRLLEDGPSPSWRDEMGEAIRALQGVEIPPPIDSGDLDSKINDLGAWSEVLDSHREEVKDLIRRAERDVTGWAQRPRAERQELLDDCQRLLDLLHGEAKRRREERLERFKRGLEALDSAVGRQGSLHEELGIVEQMESDTVEAYEHWRAEMQKADKALSGSVGGYRNELAKRLAEEWHALQRAAKEQIGQPLTAERRREIRDVEEAAGIQAETREPHQLPGAIRSTRELAQRMRNLVQEAADERHQYDRSVAGLAQRHSDLREHAQTVGLDLENLTHAIAKLPKAKAEDFDEAWDRLGELDTRQGRLRRRFDAHCRRLLAGHREVIASVTSALQQTGVDEGGEDRFELDEGATPAEVADTLEAAERRRAELEELAQATSEALEARVCELSGELDALTADDGLPPADRATRDHLARLLSDVPGAPLPEHRTAQGPDLDRIVELSRRRDEVEDFLDRLREPERQSREMRDDLHTRLRSLGTEERWPELTELAQRAAGLVNGAPTAPARSRQALAQLTAAEHLLDALEHQSRRLAAERLERHRRILVRHRDTGDLGGAGDPGAGSSEVKELLERLDACDPARLPPAALRSRIAALAERLEHRRTSGGH